MTETLVLCYHSVSPTWAAETSVTPAALEAQLRLLLRRGWRPATLLDGMTAPAAARTMMVTFDDAHESVLTLAAPILERLGVPATVFVPTDYPDSGRLMGWDGYHTWLGTPDEQELRCLSWEELRGLAAKGWEIASHTCSHPRLTTISDDQLLLEMTRSRAVCEEQTGVACPSIAYPYGDFDDRVVRAARAAGYSLAVTTTAAGGDQLPLQLPRVVVYHGDDAARVVVRAWRRAHPAVDASLHRARDVAARLRRR